jgi:WhiB family redox-sensing transcriptional regulator
MSWQLEASCSEDQHDLFFSQAKGKMDRAIQICNSCSVKGECLKFAIDEKVEFGIFGGLTPQERKKKWLI